MALTKLISLLKALPNTLETSFQNTLEDNAEFISNLNRGQLSKGVDRDGDKLGKYATSSKASRKRKGLQTNFIDLKVTGDFHKSIQTKQQTPTSFTMHSNNKVWNDHLKPQERFEDSIGLTKESQKIVNKLIAEGLKKDLTKSFA